MPSSKKAVKKNSKKSKPSKDSKKAKKTKETTTTESSQESENTIIEESFKDSDVLSSEDINIDSESEVNNCEIDKMIQDDIEFFNNDDSSEIEEDSGFVVLEKDQRITNPRLTRYEMVRILGERTKQLTMGAKPLVKNYHELSYEDIAIEELKHNMIPFKIKRALPNHKVEVWELNELDKKHLDTYIESA